MPHSIFLSNSNTKSYFICLFWLKFFLFSDLIFFTVNFSFLKRYRDCYAVRNETICIFLGRNGHGNVLKMKNLLYMKREHLFEFNFFILFFVNYGINQVLLLFLENNFAKLFTARESCYALASRVVTRYKFVRRSYAYLVCAWYKYALKHVISCN